MTFRYALAALAGAAIVMAAFVFGKTTAHTNEETPTSLVAGPTTTSLVTTTAPPATASTTAPAPSTTTTTSTAPPVESIADIVERAGRSVVQIENAYSSGSGIIYDSSGHVLTAAHVVDGNNDRVTVRLADGRELEGNVIGRHEPSDIAVISVQDGGQMPVAELGRDTDLTIGELAIALGSPFGFEQTVTAGIISSIDRLVDGIAMIQTDAAINPGNSGGPLLDGDGRVIGINDIIFSTTGTNDGIGFAISIDVASIVADQIIAGDDVQLAYLGVTVSDETGTTPGAVIDRVAARSPASEAGLMRGDIIVSIDGRPVNRADVVQSQITRHRPGETIDIGIIRDGDEQVHAIELATRDE